jgi:hypothetical protein
MHECMMSATRGHYGTELEGILRMRGLGWWLLADKVRKAYNAAGGDSPMGALGPWSAELIDLDRPSSGEVVTEFECKRPSESDARLLARDALVVAENRRRRLAHWPRHRTSEAVGSNRIRMMPLFGRGKDGIAA